MELGRLTYRGCVGCRRCRRDTSACALEDDLTPVLASVAGARAFTLATPIYYGYATGLFKSFLDRWFSLRDGEGTLRAQEGRPALLVVTQGHPDPAAYEWTRSSLEKVLASYGCAPEVLVAPGLREDEDLEARTDLLTRARELGRELARRAPPATPMGEFT